MHPWEKEIQVCKITLTKFLKNHLCRTTGPILTKLGAMYLCVKEIQVLMNDQCFYYQKDDIDFFVLMLWHHHRIAQMWLMIGTVSRVSDVAN